MKKDGASQPLGPTRWQYFVASAWPARLWFGSHAVLAGTVATCALLSTGSTPRQITSVLLFGVVLACSLAASFLLGGLTGLLVLGPGFRGCGVANGAPYAVGDRVRILAGSDLDRVASVYEVWEERRQVRVDLGPERRNLVTDVFAYYEVLRAPKLKGQDAVEQLATTGEARHQ